MSSIHREESGYLIDDEDIWIGKPAPQGVPAFLRNGLDEPVSREELMSTLKRGRRRNR